jgi:TonB family protein
VHISETGSVESAEVVRGPIHGHRTALEDAALAAARQWRFKPYIKDGKAAKVTTTLPFDFNLGNQVPDWGSEDPSHAQQIPTGGGVPQGKLIHRVEPGYPLEAKFRRISGQVILDAQIGKDGSIRYLHVVQGDPILARAAIDAVKNWKYKPYVLAGEAVDVSTQITVNFTLYETPSQRLPPFPH